MRDDQRILSNGSKPLHVSDTSVTEWGWSAWMSSVGGASPSEEECHVILLEAIVLPHFKPPIGSKHISAWTDNCITWACVNKQHFIHPAVEACRGAVISGFGECLPPLGIFTSQACREHSRVVCPGARPWCGSGGWTQKSLSWIWTP